MTDIKEPINTTSDGTFLSVVCENPEKIVIGQKLGGHSPPRNYPPDTYMQHVMPGSLPGVGVLGLARFSWRP